MVKLKVEETSGVDHPAHLEEGWIVIKSKGAPVAKKSMMEEEETEKAGKMPAFIQAKIDAREAKDEDEDEDDEETMKAMQDEETDFEAMFAKMKSERDMYKNKYESFEKKYGAMDDEEDSMEKAMPQPVRAMLEKARNEAETARTALRKEVDARKDSEFVAKASAWGALSVDPKTIGPVLRKMADVDADLTETVMEALSSANAQAEAANIFAELGTSVRPDSGDTMGRITKMAKSAVANGDHKTVEQAISALMVTNPELYDAYRQESHK